MISVKVATTSTRPINRLIERGVSISSLRYDREGITFRIKSSDMSSVSEILKGYSLDMVDENTLSRLKSLSLARIGMIMGLLISIICIIILNMMTLDVCIIGASQEDRDVIESVLVEHGLRPYTFKEKRLGVLEDEILDSLDDISYVRTYYEGGRLNVIVKRTLPTPPLGDDNNTGIIANYDGIVTRIIATQGTPLVKVGDSVHKGDMLIAPYVIYGEGDEARTREVVPIGEVYARTYLEENVTLSETNVFLTETGRVKVRHSLLQRPPKSPFEHYRVRTERHRLFSLIPMAYTTYTYEELEEHIITHDDPRLVDYAINCAYYKLDERLFEGEIVLNKWFFKKRLDNLYIISVYYEVEKLISGGKLE